MTVDVQVKEIVSVQEQLAAALKQVDHLTRALSSNRTIGMAVGLLMAEHGLTEQAAFDVLIRASQGANVKIRTIAAQMVDWHSERVSS